jgi:hypothetical protein
MIAVPARLRPTLRDADVVDKLMAALPIRKRRWCGNSDCECSGCANDVVSREEWMAWFIRRQNAICEHCDRAVRLLSRDGRTYLACEVCDLAWA